MPALVSGQCSIHSFRRVGHNFAGVQVVQLCSQEARGGGELLAGLVTLLAMESSGCFDRVFADLETVLLDPRATSGTLLACLGTLPAYPLLAMVLRKNTTVAEV